MVVGRASTKPTRPRYLVRNILRQRMPKLNIDRGPNASISAQMLLG